MCLESIHCVGRFYEARLEELLDRHAMELSEAKLKCPGKFL